ncbi:MAG TPA: glycosyltransferase family 2 protein [Blastocatellia bacterium]|nr:glycosyltransferase family 2 protein [Blastocatellia bacterium]
MNPQIAVVVVSYNTRALLLECLASVIESSREAEIELIVVDNASRDGSYEAVREAFPQAVTVRNSTNIGFGVACNQAIRRTTAPFILLLNSDARINTDALQAILDAMRFDERCGAASCRIVNDEGEEMINTRNFLTPLNQALELLGFKRRAYRPKPEDNNLDCSVEWIDGACLMLRRAALDEVGLFDEQFFMYSEDEDLCFRLKERGWKVCFSSAATVFHRGAASSSQDRTNMLRHFYSSQMLFLSKHRGRASVFLFRLAMKTALTLKLLLARLKSQDKRREEFAERLFALKRASEF